jgi:hypothetical protein
MSGGADDAEEGAGIKWQSGSRSAEPGWRIVERKEEEGLDRKRSMDSVRVGHAVGDQENLRAENAA